MAITRIPGLRGIIRGHIPKALAAGLNTVQFEGLIRGQYGQFTRRTDFLADWREMEGRERKRDPLKSIRKDLYATAATVQVSEVAQQNKFYYGYKVTGYDLITGKETEQDLVVSSSERLTEGEADREAEQLQNKYFPEITSVKFERDYVSISA